MDLYLLSHLYSMYKLVSRYIGLPHAPLPPSFQWGCCPVFSGVVLKFLVGLLSSFQWGCCPVFSGVVVQCLVGLLSSVQWGCCPVFSGVVVQCLVGLLSSFQWGCCPVFSGVGVQFLVFCVVFPWPLFVILSFSF